MKKLGVVAVFSLIYLGGCAAYSVDINGFAEADKPLKSNAAVYVASYPDSSNPIFDLEIKHKIEYLLKQQGYTPVDAENKADYYLDFRAGISSRTSYGYRGAYMPTATYGHYWGSYCSYYPEIETIYDQWLAIKVYDAAPSKPAEQHTVRWVGEAVTSQYGNDLREAVNYLLVAVFDHFGQDTNERITIGFKSKDPRILTIRQYK